MHPNTSFKSTVERDKNKIPVKYLSSIATNYKLLSGKMLLMQIIFTAKQIFLSSVFNSNMLSVLKRIFYVNLLKWLEKFCLRLYKTLQNRQNTDISVYVCHLCLKFKGKLLLFIALKTVTNPYNKLIYKPKRRENERIGYLIR